MFKFVESHFRINKTHKDIFLDISRVLYEHPKKFFSNFHSIFKTKLRFCNIVFTLAVYSIQSLTFAPRSRAAVARRAHNPKVLGSIPSFATDKILSSMSLRIFAGKLSGLTAFFACFIALRILSFDIAGPVTHILKLKICKIIVNTHF